MEYGKILKSFTSKKGNAVIFRYPEPNDLDGMLSYANAMIDEDTFILLNGKQLTREYEQQFLDGVLKQMESGDLIQIAVIINGEYAGNASIERGKYRKSEVGHVGLGLLKQYREEGIGSELMKTMIEESKHLGLRIIELSCFENNPRALHVYEKLGFIKSGVTPGAILFKNSYIGEVHYYLPLTDA